ncbi:NmrA family NAD(P)-binding protein [Dyella terrae]|uniref:NmrA family NAD(P)-binding protein n=1 Tax=Dyella terrae TaxID=522259 RepID=UPI001EFE57DE|nr:NmrA family NAD(P)-binding protein [Dyella terrae]
MPFRHLSIVIDVIAKRVARIQNRLRTRRIAARMRIPGMYAVMGVTGQVGGQVANELLAEGYTVRAILRDETKAGRWMDRGCEVALATAGDPDALATAFAGADGVFLMIPPDYDPAPGFPGVQKIIAAVCQAVDVARPDRVVFLSTVGAHVEAFSLLSNSRMVESALRELPIPTAFVRAGWFMENAAWDVAAARKGLIPSFLQPLDHPIPMVATADIAHTVAGALRDRWQGTRIIELEGPRRYSALDIASGFAAALGRSVSTEPVPRDTWENLFQTQGMQNPDPRMRMLDGFNEGWIDFEQGEAGSLKATTTLESVLRDLVERSS